MRVRLECILLSSAQAECLLHGGAFPTPASAPVPRGMSLSQSVPYKIQSIGLPCRRGTAVAGTASVGGERMKVEAANAPIENLDASLEGILLAKKSSPHILTDSRWLHSIP
jgi:hypothetical protein